MEVLGRIGFGTSVSIDDIRHGLLLMFGRCARGPCEEEITTEQVERMFSTLDAVWR